MSTFPEHPEIDFLILADKAEAVNGKLYLMGGAWDRLYIADFSQPVAVSIAIGILVPWSETNRDHPLTISIESEDGNKLADDLHAGINMGRPPIAVPGQPFRAIMTIDSRWTLPQPGTYRITATIGTESTKRVVFLAEKVGQPAAPQPKGNVDPK